MKSLRNFLIAAAGFVIVIGLLVPAGLQAAPPGPVGPVKPVEVVNTPLPVTITGTDTVLPADIVSLRLSSAACSVSSGGFLTRPFAEPLPDGSQQPSGARFVVPAGQVFVATSLQYSTFGTTPGGTVLVDLVRVSPTAASINLPFRSVSFANANGFTTGSETMPTGIVFGPGVEPCITAASATGAKIGNATMQGYLAPAPTP